MKPRQSQNDNADSAPTGPNYIAMACAFIALVPELVLHDPRTFGVRSAAPRAAGAVLLTYVFAICYTFDDKVPLLILALATILLSVFAYFYALLRERRGYVWHSRYNGRPWLTYLPPMSEERMKRCEPLMIVVAGWGLNHWNCPLGTFVITAGACHGLRVIVESMATRTRELDFNDALAEQTIAMRAMKRRRRN